MIKVKEFTHYDYREAPLDQQVNNFIKDKEIIDIKYQVTSGEDGGTSALVIYKDSDNNA